MCTVTYLPLNKEDFILTSNRDVSFAREKALPPKIYMEDGIELFYPKDGKAGGTWIGSSSMNRLICLLNGGFENHITADWYAKSRGEIVKELLKSNTIHEGLQEVDLQHIEPFTLVIVDWNSTLKVFEFVWDGKQKHLKNLPNKPQIWSSSTLYTEEMKKMRKDWFENWKMENEINSESILRFHREAGIGDPRVDVLMHRKNVGTVSITQVSSNSKNVKMDYLAIIP